MQKKSRENRKIFDPETHTLPNGCKEFAQSPQVLVFDDFIRIYFSTRAKDHAGKYLSHIAYIDLDKNFKKILRISDHTVIPLGKLGCYDEHGIFPFNVVRDKEKILGYIGGWSRRTSVSVETSIGVAVSHDKGVTFQRVGDGPILTSSLNEPFLIGDPFVSSFDGTFHMWYIFGTKWIDNPDTHVSERVYKIGHATSNDGMTWVKEERKLMRDKLNENECQALPTVIKIHDVYHMFFCYRQAIGFRENKNNAYRIGYAFSKDNAHWMRDDTMAGIDVSTDDWDSDMLCYPRVFHCDNDVYMLYNGNQFGRFGFGLAVLEKM